MAAKGGGNCQIAGAVVVSNSVIYTCTKVDKKLKWISEPSKSDTGSTKANATLPAYQFATWIEDVITIVNKERSDTGLDSLSECSTLDQSALLHSQDMNVRNFFAHTNPDGKTASDRIRLTGYFGKAKSRWTGENIAAGFGDVASVMAAWSRALPISLSDPVTLPLRLTSASEAPMSSCKVTIQ